MKKKAGDGQHRRRRGTRDIAREEGRGDIMGDDDDQQHQPAKAVDRRTALARDHDRTLSGRGVSEATKLLTVIRWRVKAPNA